MSARIGESDVQLQPGEVAFTNTGQTHRGEAHDIEFISIAVEPALVSELAAEIGLTRAATEIVFLSSSARDETVIQMARLAVAELAAEEVGHAEMLDAMVRQLIIHLLRSHLSVRKAAQIEISRAGPVDRRLRRAIEFMHDNYSRELALEEIAAAAYLSEYHFARLFKQIMSVTPHVYLANLRLERARKLLTNTSLPISEISASVGYQSQSHFTKIFKSVTGLPPRLYREAAKD
jgi:AraC family transcriptional regulator